MALGAVLLAFVVGAVAATATTVFVFMIALTVASAVATIAGMLIASSVISVVEHASAGFIAAQVGYGLGLAVLARLDPKLNATRSDPPTSPQIHPLSTRK